jgi:SAM-dependent methyltransferase
MLNDLKQIVQNLKPRPSDEEILAKEGHREFVGGHWEEIGKLQFDFLVKQGLKPNHVLLDIACGSLRAGRLLIPYLDPGNYLGIDKHADVINAGRTKEIDQCVLTSQRPEFVVSDSFAFEKFSKRPDFCIAQSLFTHLDKQDIDLCFAKLSAFVKPGCRFFATFDESGIPVPQIGKSHSVRAFFYTRRAMESFGTRAGWQAKYIGDWGHPREQVMVEYVKQ